MKLLHHEVASFALLLIIAIGFEIDIAAGVAPTVHVPEELATGDELVMRCDMPEGVTAGSNARKEMSFQFFLNGEFAGTAKSSKNTLKKKKASKENHMGSWTCQVVVPKTGETSEHSSPKILTIFDAPLQPTLKSSQTKVNDGERVSISCVLHHDSDTASSYSFYFNGDIHLSRVKETFSSIVRQETFEGKWSCRAHNKAGDSPISKTVELRVLVVDPTVYVPEELATGDELIVKCKMPGLVLTDSDELKDTSYKFFLNGTFAGTAKPTTNTLKIKEVSKEDHMGSWTCQVVVSKTKSMSRRSAPKDLTILDAPLQPVLAFSQTKITDGEIVSISCVLSRDSDTAASYSFYINGSYYLSRVKRAFSSTVRQATFRGKWSCRAHNGAGDSPFSEERALHIIQVVPEQPTLQLDQAQVNDGDEVSFSCVVDHDSDNVLSYAFYADGSQRMKLQFTSSFTRSVEQEVDDAKWSCTALNEAGESPPSEAVALQVKVGHCNCRRLCSEAKSAWAEFQPILIGALAGGSVLAIPFFLVFGPVGIGAGTFVAKLMALLGTGGMIIPFLQSYGTTGPALTTIFGFCASGAAFATLVQKMFSCGCKCDF